MHVSLATLVRGARTETKAFTENIRPLLAAAVRCIDDVSTYNSSLALARTFLALSTLLTVLMTPAGVLFLTSPADPVGVVCEAFTSRWSLFCMAGGATPTSIIITLAVTLAVISGYLPAVTAIPHWWVAWSLNIGSPIRDGGDQVAAVLTPLLVPLLLLDRRRNHWSGDRRWSSRSWVVRGAAWAVLVVVWVQTSVLYANAAIAKFAVAEWANGTALWYWIQEPSFRPPAAFLWLAEVVQGSLAGALIVNYGVLAVELLAAGLVLVRPANRRIALPLMLAFHLSIAVMFGLWSFFLSMAALLVLYLRVPRNDRPD